MDMDIQTSSEMIAEQPQPEPENAASTSPAHATAPKSPSISFRLEPEYIEGLDRIAQLAGVDRTEAIRKLITEGCRKRGIPCKRVVLPRNDFEKQVQTYYVQQILNQLLPFPDLRITVDSKLNPKKQYELKLSRVNVSEPTHPILLGVAELHDTNGAPAIYWCFPAQAGLPEQSGELSRSNTSFSLALPGDQ